MTRSYTPSQIADGLLAADFTRDSAFVPLAEVEKLRAEMLELAEWCEAEEPLSHKKLSQRLRAALEGKQ